MKNHKKSKELIEAFLTCYQEPDFPPEQEQAVWRVLEKIAKNKVNRFLRWEDPEVIGDAVSKGMVGLKEQKPIPRPLAWFLALVDNTCREALTERKQRGEVDIRELPENEFTTEIDWSLLEDLDGALKKDEKEILQMKMEGFTEAEIAAALKEDSKEFHSRWMRLVRNLKRRLS